ncbi:hypothetical protein HZ326_20201 [Fusarium oxysporum f. sp. albedinis]|nr:hypothetical protein HZ326_20201 [Fusarium oxysporum f. sp. albedinis]
MASCCSLFGMHNKTICVGHHEGINMLGLPHLLHRQLLVILYKQVSICSLSEPDIISVKCIIAKGTSSNINAIITRMQALSTKTQTLDRGSKTGPHLFTDFMENTDEEEEGDGDVEGFDEDNIVAYLNTLHGCIIAKHVAPHIGYIPGIKPGNILFEHRRQAVGAAMQSPAGPFKVMILGGPLGLGKTLVALAVAALSWKPGDVSSFIVAPLSCCNQCGWLRLMLFLME